jgi:phenylpropionate dioxygenase-like ring-hydroxylating dioxygenase large terminal subunit
LLGHRNYWYPTVAARRVGKRPLGIRIGGDEIVLFRARGQVAALADRCPHRGAQLSRGRTVFDGTLSCGYHGWTFNREGACVARIVEGPDAQLPSSVRVRTYPVEERFGIVWLYLGDGPPPPLEEDLPPEILRPGLLTQFFVQRWNCNWSFVTDNYPDMLHALWVHRSAPTWVFQRLPAWGRMATSLLPDGKGLHCVSVGEGFQGNYLGLGQYPAHSWWRVRGHYKHSGKEGQTGYGSDVRLPGYIVIVQKDAYFGVEFTNIGWPVPIDAKRCYFWNINITQPKSPLHAAALRAWWDGFFKPLQIRFLQQDRRLEETQRITAPESLAVTDRGLVQWRMFAATRARKSPAPATNGHADGAPKRRAEPETVLQESR